jgi:hypothetical protein
MKRIIYSAVVTFIGLTSFAAPTVTDVVAKQRYPWNGLVDITCKVSGINELITDPKFVLSAVFPNSVNVVKMTKFWVVRDGVKSNNLAADTNGNYRLLWDAKDDLGDVHYTNMVVRVDIKGHRKVRLWEGGPYWATTNVGADDPWEYGYYFWWGDTIGYKRENHFWVASDGSSSNFSFHYKLPSSLKSISDLQLFGWITAECVLVSTHDAAQKHWGGDWRMPTKQEFEDLNSKCDWTWTTINDVNGYVVRGRGDYSANSIFLSCSGVGDESSFGSAGSYGYYWSSVPSSNYYFYWYTEGISYNIYYAWSFCFNLSGRGTYEKCWRSKGMPIRPVCECLK